MTRLESTLVEWVMSAIYYAVAPDGTITELTEPEYLALSDTEEVGDYIFRLSRQDAEITAARIRSRS